MSDGEESQVDEISYTMVLRNREFVKLLSGQFFSNFGDAILQIAIYLYVYSFTGDLSLTTTVLAVQLIPWIVIGPIAGVFADRISRKGIMLAADVLRTVTIASIPFQQSVEGLMVVVFLVGVASASFAAPRSAAIPEITGIKLFVKAISLSQLIFQTMRIVGPLLSAFIYAIYQENTFYLASSMYLISFVFISRTKIPSAKNNGEKLSIPLVIRDLYSGFDYLIHEKVIRKILIFFAVLVVGGAFAGTLIYPYIFEIMHGGDIALEDLAYKEFGIVGALGALGGIFGNLIFGKFEIVIGRRFALFVGFISSGLYFTIFPLINIFWILGALALISGIFNGIFSLAINAIFAETVPNEIRGRAYSATNSYVQVLSVICVLASGYVAESIGILETIFIAGVSIVFFSIIMTVATKFFLFASVKAESVPIS